jgi:hypothetical protein
MSYLHAGFDEGARFECSDGEGRMALANALGQRGSKCVTAARWKSPMMAWGTFCGCYFRVPYTSTKALAYRSRAHPAGTLRSPLSEWRRRREG